MWCFSYYFNIFLWRVILTTVLHHTDHNVYITNVCIVGVILGGTLGIVKFDSRPYDQELWSMSCLRHLMSCSPVSSWPGWNVFEFLIICSTETLFKLLGFSYPMTKTCGHPFEWLSLHLYPLPFIYCSQWSNHGLFPLSLSTVGRSQSEVSRSTMARCGLHRVHFVDSSPHRSVTPALWDSAWRTPGSSPHETTCPSSTSTPLWVNI